MKEILKAVGELLYEIFLWFGLVLAFFIGLFLMGLTFKILVNTFMAGYYLL
jgi:hypothetical protein